MNSMTYKFKYTHLLILPLSLFLTLVSLEMINVPWLSHYDQESIELFTNIKKWLNKTSIFKNKLFDPKFIENNFLIINTSYDLDIGIANKNQLPYFPNKFNQLPEQSITNRNELIVLFNWLNNHPDLFDKIICDIGFSTQSKNPKTDETLSKILNSLQNNNKIIYAGEYDKYNQVFYDTLFKNINKDNVGVCNVDSKNSFILSYKLIYEDNELSLPILMNNRIGNNKTELNNFLGTYALNDNNGISKSYYNNFIVEILYDKEYFDKLKSFSTSNNNLNESISFINLGEAASYADYVLPEILKKENNKNIFIGAFSHDHRDMHKTIYGNLDGGIILLNIYHNIKYGYNSFSWLHIISMFIFMIAVCFWIFFKKIEHNNTNSALGYIFDKIFFEHIHYFILAVMALISYFLFKHIMNIIGMGLIYIFLETINRLIKNYELTKIK